MRLLDTLCIHEAQKVIGELPDREWGVASLRFPVPTGVKGIDMIILSKRIHLPREIVTVLTVSMQQDQRFALAFFDEMMLDVHTDKYEFSLYYYSTSVF